MSKTNRPRGKRATNYTILCEWCGQRRETSRQDTRTCGDVCRARMKFYCDYLGYRPDGIVGPLTGQQGVDLELHRLIANEQRRRAAAEAERAAFLARK